MARKSLPVIVSGALFLSGCGTAVPQLHEVWEEADVDDPLAQRIKQSIYCELRWAVYRQSMQEAGVNGHEPAIPDNWGAQLTTTLQVDETGAVNPGATFNKTLANANVPVFGQTPVVVPQMFNLSAGATISSQATRIDKYYAFFGLKAFKKKPSPYETICFQYDAQNHMQPIDRHGSSLLLGNLGIENWLQGALIQQNAIPSDPLPKADVAKVDVLSYDVKFIVITTGSINPSWKLVNISAGTGALPFVSANRTRTQEMLLTLGPSVPSKDKKGAPDMASFNLHLAGEIGQAVASAVRPAGNQ